MSGVNNAQLIQNLLPCVNCALFTAQFAFLQGKNGCEFGIADSFITLSLKNIVLPLVTLVCFLKMGECRKHLLRSYKRFECNRDPKLSEVKCLEHRRSHTTRRSIYTSSSRCGAPHCGAASTARACSSVAVKCKAACLSVFTYKLTSYMSLCLWAMLQENYREEHGLQTPTEP